MIFLNKKLVQLIYAEDYLGESSKMFLVCDDPIQVGDGVCEKLTTGKWMAMTIHNENDLDLKNQKKILITEEQTGYFHDGYLTPQVGDLFNTKQPIIRHLTQDNIDFILANDGKCFIEIEQDGPVVISGGLRSEDDFGGKGLTHHINLKPKFINGKVIISLYGR